MRCAYRFAIVVLPVYEDPEDQKNSPFDLNNAEPFSWSWLSTINRVNSQVQKVNRTRFVGNRPSRSCLVIQTLILTYVTIPAQSRVNSEGLASPVAFAHYSIREVVLRRFIPARMRD